jgi:intracellular sulfur oxidation DsrE/DsrF family protein
MSSKHISEEHLNAFIDGELDALEKSDVFEALNDDSGLRQRACELRQLSELVRHAYERPPKIEKYRKTEARRVSPWGRAAAGALLLGLGTVLGWVSHQQPQQQDSAHMSAMYWDEHNAFQNTDLSEVTSAKTKKVIVHLNTSSVDKFEKALDTAEQLMQTYADSDMGAEIEVVANASAVKMLRTGYSPYADRVRELQDRYLNLTFLACKDALDHARELEERLPSEVTLLPDVDTTPSALEHILNRLSEGWVYLNV